MIPQKATVVSPSVAWVACNVGEILQTSPGKLHFALTIQASQLIDFTRLTELVRWKKTVDAKFHSRRAHNPRKSCRCSHPAGPSSAHLRFAACANARRAKIVGTPTVGKLSCVLFRCPAKLFIHQHDFGRNARPLDDRFTTYFFRIDFDEITPGPVHKSALLRSYSAMAIRRLHVMTPRPARSRRPRARQHGAHGEFRA